MQPIHKACMYGQKAAVEELKNMGASGFARAGRGGTHMLLGVAVARHCFCGGQAAVGGGARREAVGERGGQALCVCGGAATS